MRNDDTVRACGTHPDGARNQLNILYIQSLTILKQIEVNTVNIYGHIKKALYELELIFTDLSNLDNESILLSIRKSWGFIHKFIKNIEPNWTTHFNEKLHTLNYRELLITSEMLRDSFRIFELLKNERNVKYFMGRYMRLMESLLTFSKPFEESCDICQGYLFYYADLTTHKVIKECSTCSTWYDGKSGSRLNVNNVNILRAAKRSEIIGAGIFID